MSIVPDYSALPVAAPAGLSPSEEAKLRMRISIIANSGAAAAGIFAMNDPALRLVMQQAAIDVTGIHWDRYKTMYEALKGK